MTDPSVSVTVKPAATVLLLRDSPQLEVLMVQRHHAIDFASGALVFPGGKAHPDDEDPRWADFAIGWNEIHPEQRGLRIAAIREAFEEAGVLLARHRDGSPMGEETCPIEVRQDVDAGRTAFLDVVRDLDARLDLHGLSVFARWITPELPRLKRFDTWFFVAKAPVEQLAACDGRETVDAVWISPHEALRLGREGARTVIFPTRMNLKLLGESADAADAVRRAEERVLVTVQPKLEKREDGSFLVLPPNAGYGRVEEPLEEAL